MEKEMNIVSSFFYYMWNAWCKEECKMAFYNAFGGWCYLWDKYCQCYEEFGNHGAISAFYLTLDERNRELLIERALSVFDGCVRIK